MEKYIFELLINIIHCEIRHIEPSGTILERYGNSSPSEDPFITDPVFLREVLSRPPLPLPDLIRENTYIYYSRISLEDGSCILAGPVQVARGLADLSLWLAKRHRVETCSPRLPFCDSDTFLNGILLLNHSLTGCRIGIQDLCRYHGIEQEPALLKNETARLVYRPPGSIPVHNPHSHEARKLQCIQDGDITRLRECQKEVWTGELGKVGETPLRQEKNIALIVIVLASRAAIRGGLMPEQAFSMADQYILQVEKMQDILQIRSCTFEFEESFARQVHDLHMPLHPNKYVSDVKNYIYSRLDEALSVSDLAAYAGLSSDYLSSLFHRCEGISLQQYIRREKIHRAQYLLRHSDCTAGEVASHLGFCSQSHFSHAFREITGMTPTQYRNRDL